MVPDDEDIQDQQAIEAEHKAGNYNLRCNRNENLIIISLGTEAVSRQAGSTIVRSNVSL